MKLRDINWDLNKNWSILMAHKLAETLELEWTIVLQSWIIATRSFYQEFDHTPNTRVLVKYLKTKLDPSLSSLSIQATLHNNPALVLSYLAGIPKPKQCF